MACSILLYVQRGLLYSIYGIYGIYAARQCHGALFGLAPGSRARTLREWESLSRTFTIASPSGLVFALAFAVALYLYLSLSLRHSTFLFSLSTPPVMSSMRNAVQRRNHRERAQPLERQKWGILEKHKVSH